MSVDETHVVIAVGGGEAPGATARLAGVKDANLLFGLDLAEAAFDGSPRTVGNNGFFARHATEAHLT
jgi:hypothetical protein